MPDVLVSPLGFSPGAVSGVALALTEADYKISHVITVGTSHDKVKDCERILTNFFHDTQIIYEPMAIMQSELREQDDSATSFAKKIGEALEKAQAIASGAHDEVHTAITAGRSGMGALATLATNLYGTDYLWHFWVHEEIERGGRIENLSPPYDMDNDFLNPTRQEGQYELVRLPFLDLRPLQPFLLYQAQPDQAPPPDSPFYNQVMAGELQRLAEIFPSSLSIANVQQLVALARQYPTMTDPQKEQALWAIFQMLQNVGIGDESTRRRLQQFVMSGAAASDILPLLTRSPQKNGFTRWLEQLLVNNQPQIVGGTSIVLVLAELGQLWLQYKALYP